MTGDIRSILVECDSQLNPYRADGGYMVLPANKRRCNWCKRPISEHNHLSLDEIHATFVRFGWILDYGPNVEYESSAT